MNFTLMNLVKLTDPSFRFHDQFNYGNREILLEYLSLPKNLIILGNIQSGFSSYEWQPSKLRLANGKLAYHYLWSCPEHFAFRKDIRAIGAMWLYFLEMEFRDESWFNSGKDISLKLPGDPECIGYIPSKLGNSKLSNPKMHHRNAQHLRRKFGSATRIKVLLDARDLLSNETRLAYTDLGIEVKCNGWNGSFLINGKMGDEKLRTHFYLEMFKFLKSIDCVVSESFGSHLLYSLSINVPVRISQRVSTRSLLVDEFDDIDKQYIDFKIDYEKQAAKLFPGLFTEDTLDQSEWRSQALRILGLEEYLSARDNLRNMLLLKRVRNHHFVVHTKSLEFK